MAVELLESTRERLMVAPTVLAEVCYLLHERAGARAEVRFLRAFEVGDLELCDLTLTDVRRAAILAERYADLGLGGIDASIVAIAERLQVTRIATFDRHHFGVSDPTTSRSLPCFPRMGNGSGMHEAPHNLLMVGGG